MGQVLGAIVLAIFICPCFHDTDDKKKVILADVFHSPGVVFSQQQYENFKLEFSGRCMLRGVHLSEVLI